MDPDASLQELRVAITETGAALDAVVSVGNGAQRHEAAADLFNAANELTLRAEALVGWLDRGGFLPSSWRNSQPGLDKG